MKTSVANAIANIKRNGMSHIKFELEAQLSRQAHRIPWRCEDCNGDRMGRCGDCHGLGFVQSRGLPRECGRCNGMGGASCASCSGRGNRGDFSEVEVCQAYIQDYIARKVYGKSIAQLYAEGKRIGDSDGRGGQQGGTALPFINYAKFYYDGSVDSELTITIPIEFAHYSDIILEAFISLAKLASNDTIDTRGAGMHIAVLPEGCDGIYPSSVRLNPDGLRNFTREVGKLLPALYFVGTAGHRSRSMQYRSPRISNDNKYSAIYTLGGRVFEFRVFETCYDRPEAVFEYIQVISNALNFYGDPTRKVKALGKSFGFPNSTEIAHYYNTSEQLRILNATVKYLKPQDKSFKKMKDERGVKYTIKSLATKEKSRLGHLRAEYMVYKKHHDHIRTRPITKQEQQQIDWLMLDEGWTDDKAREYMINQRQRELEPMAEFIRKNITKQRYNQTVTV